MRYYEFAGTPREIGTQIGQTFAPLIEASIAGLCPQHAHHATPQRIAELTEETIEHHRRFFPAYIEELEGIAQGSGLPLQDIACLALRVYHRFDPGRPECEEHCYVVGVNDSQEGPVLGGVLEDYPFFPSIQKITPAHGYRLIHLVWPGTHWSRGINEHGLCITGASAEAGKLKPGAPGLRPQGDRVVPLTYVLLQQCRTVAEALEFVKPFEMVGLSGMADATGEMVLLEAVKGFKALRRPEQDVLVATSYFRSPEMLDALDRAGYDHEWAINFFGGVGRERYEIMERLLLASQDRSPIERLQEVFSSHEGSKQAMPCNANNVNSVIFLPRAKRCLAAGRFACSSPWVDYAV